MYLFAWTLGTDSVRSLLSAVSAFPNSLVMATRTIYMDADMQVFRATRERLSLPFVGRKNTRKGETP